MEEMASSVDHFALSVNWNGSRVGGRHDLSWDLISLSRHLMVIGVRGIRMNSSRSAAVACFGTGTMVEVFRHVGTSAWSSYI